LHYSRPTFSLSSSYGTYSGNWILSSLVIVVVVVVVVVVGVDFTARWCCQSLTRALNNASNRRSTYIAAVISLGQPSSTKLRQVMAAEKATMPPRENYPGETTPLPETREIARKLLQLRRSHHRGR
jgi:hypothetical protein